MKWFAPVLLHAPSSMQLLTDDDCGLLWRNWTPATDGFEQLLAAACKSAVLMVFCFRNAHFKFELGECYRRE